MRAAATRRSLGSGVAIALSAIDPDNAYRHLELRGTVAAIDPDPDHSLIHAMAKKYLGADVYPWGKPGDERVIVVGPDEWAAGQVQVRDMRGGTQEQQSIESVSGGPLS